MFRLALATALLLSQWPGAATAAASAGAARCAEFTSDMTQQWPDPSTKVLSATWVPEGPLVLAKSPAGAGIKIEAPAHCEIIAATQERLGTLGQHYVIRFHLRLPESWNGRLLFQGGGGSNGVLGDAIGAYSAAARPALMQGFAVVSQDSGHDNSRNDDPTHGGVAVFGFDELARANYGHASLPIVTDAAKAAIKIYYTTAARFSYFVGCSKGGEEGLALAERYGAEFDGIAASAPGMSLPRAAVEEAWDTQALASVIKPSNAGTLQAAQLSSAFTDADLALIRKAVLNACDADDGVVDGIVGNPAACTTEKVRPRLNGLICAGPKTESCLSRPQLSALLRLMHGAQDSSGRALYTDWPWDTGLAAPGWRQWKLGSIQNRSPALNVVLGGSSLASGFTTPPTALNLDPQTLIQFMLHFDFDRDAPKIYATSGEFPNSAWTDISARSSDLDAFRAHRGKILVVQGVSDPVFSIHDTIAWWTEVNDRNQGHAQTFVRLFPVPGMTHCGGGDATDQYDVLAPLMQWVERHQAPSSILATAGLNTPWPKRTRPLCPYPTDLHYKGSGDIESAVSFECR